MIKKNIGPRDRIVRLLFFFILFYLGFFSNPLIDTGLPKRLIGILSFVPLLTALTKFCPIYLLVGLDTHKK